MEIIGSNCIDEEIIGNVIVSSIMDTLDILGVLTIINNEQYTLSILWDSESSGSELTREHVVRIGKTLYIGDTSDVQFVNGEVIDIKDSTYIQTLKDLRENDLEFEVADGIHKNEFSGITLDREGVWYIHSLEVILERGNKDDKDYIRHIYEVLEGLIGN